MTLAMAIGSQINIKCMNNKRRNKLDSIEIKNLSASKDFSQKNEKTTYKIGENICKLCVSISGLYPKYKKYMTQQRKDKQLNFKMGKIFK